MTHLIAVYGSLLSDLHNHHILGKSKCIDREMTVNGTLYSLGGFPGLKLTGDTPVKLEVYEVDDDTLARLDRLEGYPTFYDRKVIGYLLESTPIQVYEWQGTPSPRHPIVESGDWKSYYNHAHGDRE